MASRKAPDVEPYVDPVVEFYKKSVDRAALRENLKLTVEERLNRLQHRAGELAGAAAAKPTAMVRPTPVVREAPPPYGGEDPVIDVYKKDVDRTLLRERLKLTVDQRLRDLEQLQADVRELQRAGRAGR